MSMETFLMLLFTFSVISGLFTECVKKIMNDKANMSYNLIALFVALVVGSVGTAIYYQLNGICFNTNNIIYIALLGLSSGLCSMLGYDKVKQTILQIASKKVEED